MKNVTDQLSMTDSLFRSLFENSPLGMIVYSSSEWVAVSVNESACKMLGYRTEEMLGLKLDAITHPEDLTLELTVFQKIVNRELSTSELEARYITKSSEVIWVNLFMSIIRNEGEATDHIVFMLQDISSSKKVEANYQEIEKRYSRLFKSSPICIHELDLDGCFLSMSPAGLKMLGLQNEVEVVGNLYFDSIAETDQAHIKELFRAACEGNPSEFQFRSKAGSRIYKSGFVPLFDEQRKVINIMGLTQDVTELTQAQSSLHDALEANIVLLNAFDGAAVLMDTNRVLLLANQTMANRYERPLDELIGRDVLSLFPLDLIEQRKNKMEEVIKTGKPIQFIDQRNGRILDNTIYPIFDAQHKVVKIAAYSIDTTEKMKLQNELEFKNFAIDESINGMAMSDIHGKLFYVNKACLQMWRHTDSIEVIGKSVFDFWKWSGAAEEVTKTLLEKRQWEGELVALRSDNTEAIFQVSAKLLFKHMEPIALMASFVDITERKQAEKAWQENESRLSLIFNTSSDLLILMEVTSDDRFICETVNTAYVEGMKASFPGISYQFIGQDRKEIMKACGFSHEIIDYEILQYQKAIKTKEVVYYEVEYPTPIHPLWMEVTIRPILDHEGYCTHLLRNGRDITVRKGAERLLRESEERLSLALSTSNQGIYDLNLLTGEAKVTDEYPLMLGFDPVTFKETNFFWRERLHPEDKEKVSTVFASYIKGEVENYSVEFRHLAKSGEWIWILSTGKIVAWDAEGRPIRMIGTHKDISDRKKTELILQKTNKELQEIIDALNQSSLVSITDKAGTIVKVNKRFCEVARYKEEELLGKNHRIINSGYHNKEFWSDFWITISRGEVWHKEIKNKAKDGTEYWVDTVINPIRTESGAITHYLSIRQDITDRKIYEKLLLQSNSRLAQIEQFIDLTTDAILVSDEQGKLIYLNHVAAERLGIDQNDCRLFHVQDFEQALKEGDSWKRHIEELKNKEHIDSEGININQKTGVQFPVEVTVRYVVIQNKGYIIAVSRDITERKKIEIFLRENEARLMEAQRLAKLGYWEFDLATGKVWWSDEQYEINGIARTDLPQSQESFFNLVHPDDKAVFSEMLNKVTPESPEFSIDLKIVRPSKEVRVIHAIVKTFFNKQGQPITRSGINQDITERFIANKLLKESEETLYKAQRVAKIGSWKLNVKNDILEWSDEAYAIFNVPIGQKLTYEDFLSYIHPEDKENVDKAWTAALSGAPYDIVHRILVSDKIKWVREQAELTFDEYRNLIYGFGTVQDITDQKNLQDANLIFNQSQILTGIGSWRWVLRLNELFWSDNIYTLYGLKKGEIEPSFENYINSIYREDRERVRALVEKSIANKEQFEIECRVENSMGQIRWIMNKGNVLTDKEGNAIEIYGIVRDISFEKSNTEELIGAMKRAEEASFVKDEFLSIMSHEVRTPLNSVIGLANLLLRRGPREDQLEVMKTLKGSADNLLHLVNDILDFSKIRAGKVEVESQLFDLHKFLNHLHASFNPLALDKGLGFSIQSDPQLSDLLRGDVTRLNQIFNNLLGNAIKFTHRGHVKLLVNRKKISEKTCTIIFSVEDTGVGIVHNKLDTIFLPFHQSERDTARKYGGTGLGLSIVKALVELLQGKLYVTSVYGKGSVFTVELELPFNTSTKESALSSNKRVQSGKDVIPSKGLNVLYVEDVESNRFLIENLLLDNAIDCVSVSSGRAALKSTKLKKFDLILMDIQMPVMDGYQATNKIRMQVEGKNKKTPILAFTAEPYSEELKSKVIQHRMQDVISKPFDMDLLLAKIGSYTKSKERDPHLFSFSFYEKAFDHDVKKLGKIKKAVISDVKRFEKKLTASDTSKNIKTLRSEIHRIKPIIKNLACNALLELLENYKIHEVYAAEVKIVTRKAKKVVKQLLTQLSKLKY